MTSRRQFLVAIGAGLSLAQLAAHAQQPAKVARIGFLGLASASGYVSEVEAVQAGLRDLGYVEGKNIVIEFRWAEGKYERLPELAAELVRLKVDVIVTHGFPGPRAAKQATTTIPIVIADAGDPVASGLVASLARPGGNITGSVSFQSEPNVKRLELLKEVIPCITRVAVLSNPGNPATGLNLEGIEVASKEGLINSRLCEALCFSIGQDGSSPGRSLLRKPRSWVSPAVGLPRTWFAHPSARLPLAGAVARRTDWPIRS